MPWVDLPAGARSLSMKDDRRYTGGEGDRVWVSDANARLIGEHTLAPPAPRPRSGGRERWCEVCSPPRRWFAWTTECPRCGAATLAWDG